VASIFTSQTPAVTNQFDSGSNYTLGTLFTAAVDGTIDGIRWYTPTTVAGVAVDGILYQWNNDSSGTELGREAFGALTGGQWNEILFDTPVAVVAGQRYVACIGPTERYTLTGAFFTSALINGDLTAPADDAVTPARNGRFRDAAGTGFPTSSFNASCYFVDVVFTAGGAPDVAGAGSQPMGALGRAAGEKVAFGAARLVVGAWGRAAGDKTGLSAGQVPAGATGTGASSKASPGSGGLLVVGGLARAGAGKLAEGIGQLISGAFGRTVILGDTGDTDYEIGRPGTGWSAGPVYLRRDL
jgi:hypothetical protein